MYVGHRIPYHTNDAKALPCISTTPAAYYCLYLAYYDIRFDSVALPVRQAAAQVMMALQQSVKHLEQVLSERVKMESEELRGTVRRDGHRTGVQYQHIPRFVARCTNTYGRHRQQ